MSHRTSFRRELATLYQSLAHRIMSARHTDTLTTLSTAELRRIFAERLACEGAERARIETERREQMQAEAAAQEAGRRALAEAERARRQEEEAAVLQRRREEALVARLQASRSDDPRITNLRPLFINSLRQMRDAAEASGCCRTAWHLQAILKTWERDNSLSGIIHAMRKAGTLPKDFRVKLKGFDVAHDDLDRGGRP